MTLDDFFYGRDFDLVCRAREKDKAETELSVRAVKRSERKEGTLRAVVTRYAFSGGSAVRAVLTDGDRVAFVSDRFGFDTSQCAYASFVLPAGDALRCNVADKNRLVFRDGVDGAKFFRLLSRTDGVNSLESDGLLLPDGVKDGKRCFTTYAGLYRYGTDQLDHYIIVRTSENEIGRWHITSDGAYEVTGADGACAFRIAAEDARVTLTAANGESVFVET